VQSIIYFDSARDPDRMSDVCDLLSRAEAGGRTVTLREYLTLMEAIEKDLAGRRIMPNAVRGARARRRRRHVARRV
jgi:hypothetical protein